MPLQYRVNWQIPGGGPGVSVLHGRTDGVATTGEAAEALADRARQLFVDIQLLFPVEVIWSFPDEVLELDTSSGALLQVHPVDGGAIVGGGSAGAWAAPAGAKIQWGTAGVRNGRRVQGETFLVPLGGAQYQTDGTLVPGAINTLQTAANAYIASNVFTAVRPGVWSRPKVGPPVQNGQFFDATSAAVPDRVAVLRSRRD